MISRVIKENDLTTKEGMDYIDNICHEIDNIWEDEPMEIVIYLICKRALKYANDDDRACFYLGAERRYYEVTAGHETAFTHRFRARMYLYNDSLNMEDVAVDILSNCGGNGAARECLVALYKKLK